jgi:hypothetical protein
MVWAVIGITNFLVCTYLNQLYVLSIFSKKQGWQIFLDTMYQKGDNIADAHKLYQIAMK